MSNNFKLRSNDLSKLNEALQKLTILENAKVVKNPMLEADGKFMSVINMDDDFNHNVVNGIDVEEEKDEKVLEKKAHLVSEVESKLKQALKNNDEINALLKKIDKINSDTKSMQWTLNDKGNTALLKDKNAQIFKQNNNLCLSVNDNVHLFDSVRKLHDWLTNHNFPVPKGIRLTEANEDSEKTDEKKPKVKHDRVDSLYQVPEIKDAITKVKDLQDLMEISGMNDTNVLLSSVFKNDNSLKNQLEDQLIMKNLSSGFEDDIEECTTTGDLGMTTTYLANKKEEAALEEWSPSPVFGLVDDQGKALAYQDARVGARAVCAAIFKDTAFDLNDNDTIQMTQEEFDHWKELADEMEFLTVIAVPVFAQKDANDYVNEKIEKEYYKSGLPLEKFAPIVKDKVKAKFNYDLTDDEIAIIIKRNAKGKNVGDLDKSLVRTDDEQNRVKAIKKAMGQSKGARENAVEEIFGNFDDPEERGGYLKYKKFVDLMNKNKIQIVDQHDPAKNIVPQAGSPSKGPAPVDKIYKTILQGDRPGAKTMIQALSPKDREEVKAEILRRTPNLKKFIEPLFAESVQENSLLEAFLKSMGA